MLRTNLLRKTVWTVLFVLLVSFLGMGKSSIQAAEETPDFTMTELSLSLTASEILSKGTITEDPTKFNRGGRAVEASTDGQVFWHSGAGDTFTFTVDFGTFAADTLTFRYGGPAMTLHIYADGTLAGSGAVEVSGRDVLANLCIVPLTQKLTGVKEICLEVESDTAQWPGTDYGYITFLQKDVVFKMTEENWNLKAEDILNYGTFSSDSTKFDRGGHEIAANLDGGAAYVGQFFIHSGAGDAFTFKVDFGTYTVDRMTFLHGGPAMQLKVYADGELIGVGNAEASVRYGADAYASQAECVVLFSQMLTGEKEIVLEVASDTAQWPGTDYGNIIFYHDVPNVPTADTLAQSYIILFTVSFAGVTASILLKKRYKGVF